MLVPLTKNQQLLNKRFKMKFFLKLGGSETFYMP